MPEVIQGMRGITSGFDKINWNTFFNHSSSALSSSTVLLLTATGNCISKTNKVLPHFGKFDSHGKNELLWWFHNLEFDSAMANCLHNYRHRSSFRQMHPKKAGSCMLRNQNRESVVQEGAGSTYQPAGTFSHKVCHFDICQNVENVSHTFSGRQHDSLELFAANRRDKVSHKKIWEFTLGQKITITSKPLPGNLNYNSE